MSTPSLSDCEQKTQRGFKRKAADSVVEHSSSPESPSKRLRRSPENIADRTDSTSSETSNAASVNEVLFNPDGKFYYEDGDILLIVEHTFFCVHTEKLKAAGGIFEDILSGHIRPSKEEFLYGLPMLYVPLVSLRQLRFFLAYIYGTIQLRTECPDNHDDSRLYWEAAITLLDVSTKLNLYPLRKSVISALECLFPTNATVDYIPNFRPTIAGYQNLAEEKMFYRTFPIKAINLFHEHGVPSMLPMAYYHAAQLSLEDIVSGVEDNGALWKLDSVDIIKILKGREKLKTSRRQVLFAWFDERMIEDGPEHGGNTCEMELMLNGNSCWDNFIEIYSKFNRSGFLDDIPNGLQGLSETAERILQRYLCHMCSSDALYLIAIGEDKNWINLPEHFGFKDWDAVKELQENIDRGWEGEY